MNRQNNNTPEKNNGTFSSTSTTLIIGSVSSTARKQLRSHEVTPRLKPSCKKQRVNQECTSDEDEEKTIIDLTRPKLKDLLPGTPFHVMKSHNSLFYVYDPRGYKGKVLPKGYCVDCRCPKNYCASLMYSKVITERVKFLIKEKGRSFLEEEDITDMYEEVYAINVYAKLMANGIKFEETRLEMTLPPCLERRGLNRLLKSIEKENKAEDAWNWEERDCTLTRIQELAEKYKTNCDGEVRIYEGRKPCYEVRNLMKENENKTKKGTVETSDV